MNINKSIPRLLIFLTLNIAPVIKVDENGNEIDKKIESN
jgi:hypothetical protein